MVKIKKYKLEKIFKKTNKKTKHLVFFQFFLKENMFILHTRILTNEMVAESQNFVVVFFSRAADQLNVNFRQEAE